MNHLAEKIIYDEEENEIPFNPMYPIRNYEQQETCAHRKFTLKVNEDKIFFQCDCSLTLGEDGREMPQILERVNGLLQGLQRSHKLVEVKL